MPPGRRARERIHQWLELLADDVEMHSVLTPELPDDFAAPPRRGKAGAMEYVQTAGARLGDDPVHLSTASSTAATTSSWSAIAPGATAPPAAGRHAQGRRLAFRGRPGDQLPRNVRQPRLRSRDPVRRRDGPRLTGRAGNLRGAAIRWRSHALERHPPLQLRSRSARSSTCCSPPAGAIIYHRRAAGGGRRVSAPRSARGATSTPISATPTTIPNASS